MTIRIEKSGFVWTIIHSRPEARGAMDPEQANALYEAFLAFNADDNAYVAVFWGEGGAFCSGWDLKYAASLDANDFVADYEFPDTDSHSIARQACDCCHCRSCCCGRNGISAIC